MTSERSFSLRERISEALSIPPDITAGTTRITAYGYRRLEIENHCGVVEYGSQRIVINCGKYLIAISGDALTITAMDSSEIAIGGNMTQIEYLFRGEI